MRAFVCTVLGVLVVAAPLGVQGSPAQEAAKKELQQWQGNWRVEALETNGEKTAPDDLKERTVFVGFDAFMVKDGEKVLQLAKVKVDPSKTPGTVNAFIVQGANKGDIMMGIFERKG